MRHRGGIPSPRHALAAARPHVVSGDTPAQFLTKPAQLSMWLNDQFGDCVSAEEAFAKACHNPEIFIKPGVVFNWASARDVLNGATVWQVLHEMQLSGFEEYGKVYNDGPFTSVDWTDAVILRNAISKGPVKIGASGDELDNIVPDPPTNGWLATGLKGGEQDHCVCFPGFGTIEWLLQQLGKTVPSGVDGTAPGYALFTWSSIGVIDVPSMLAITGEAWLRTPTTVVK